MYKKPPICHGLLKPIMAIFELLLGVQGLEQEIAVLDDFFFFLFFMNWFVCSFILACTRLGRGLKLVS